MKTLITFLVALFVFCGVVFIVFWPVIYQEYFEASPSSQAKAESNWWSLGFYRVTAYCPCEKCCGEYADNKTACGYNTGMGGKFVAAPAEFRFTTVLRIEPYGAATVLDRGGSIRGKRLDVYFPTHQEALEWGVKELEVFIYARDE